MRYPIINRVLGELVNDEREDLFGSFFNGPDVFGISRISESAAWAPKMNISDNDNEVEVEVAVPGVDKKDIKVDISNNILTVSGERKTKQEHKEKNNYICEQSYGAFRRSVKLPFDLKADLSKASYDKGILKIILPKDKERKSKTLEIK